MVSLILPWLIIDEVSRDGDMSAPSSMRYGAWELVGHILAELNI
jgi:hypothetical protein